MAYRILSAVKIFPVLLWLHPILSAFVIKDFKPDVVPLRQTTVLTILTSDLNTSTGLLCRFNDISSTASKKGNLLHCTTPPMKETSGKVVLNIEVNGTFYKAKKHLRFHKPFKVTELWPKMAFPSQQIHLLVKGIECESWMKFFVRFQTKNGTRRTERGVCANSTITSYLPEFEANTLLRVGVTLTNKIVQWSQTKLFVQYPIDSIRSSIVSLQADIQEKGAFLFHILPRDRFNNSLLLQNQNEFEGFSVQYHPKQRELSTYSFLDCDASINQPKKIIKVRCGGARSEYIVVYPTINNVVIGGRKSYEVSTTLCPGKPSCSGASRQEDIAVILLPSILIPIALAVISIVVYRKVVRDRKAWTWKTPRITFSEHESNQEVEMLMQSPGDSYDHGGDQGGDDSMNDGLDNVLIEDQEDDLHAVESGGVCIVTDGSVGLAQTVSHSHFLQAKKDTALEKTDKDSKTFDNIESENTSPCVDSFEDKLELMPILNDCCHEDSQSNITKISGNKESTNSKQSVDPPTSKDEATGAEFMPVLDPSSVQDIQHSDSRPTDAAQSEENVNCDMSTLAKELQAAIRSSNDGIEATLAADTSVTIGAASQPFSSNEVDNPSSSEDEDNSLRHKLLAELKSRLKSKIRRSKIEDNEN